MAYTPHGAAALERMQEDLLTALSRVRQAPGTSINVHAANFRRALEELEHFESSEPALTATSLSKLAHFWKTSLDYGRYATYVNDFDRLRTTGFPATADIHSLLSSGTLECERLERLTASAGALRAPRDSIVASTSHHSSTRSRDSDRPREPDRRASERPRESHRKSSDDRPREPDRKSSDIPRDSNRTFTPRNSGRKPSGSSDRRSRDQHSTIECTYHRDVLGQPGKRHSDADCRVKQKDIAEGRYHSVSAVICTSVHESAPPPHFSPLSTHSEAFDPAMATDRSPVVDVVIDVHASVSSPRVVGSVPAQPSDAVPLDPSPAVVDVVANSPGDTNLSAASPPPPLLPRATRKKIREFHDPYFFEPSFLAQLQLVETDRDPAILTTLLQKAFAAPSPDDDSIHPGAVHAFVYLRLYYDSAKVLSHLKRTAMTDLVPYGRILKSLSPALHWPLCLIP